MNNEKIAAGFAQAVVRWQRRRGRNDLPWQNAPDPYRVWLSEIMLQQTQVAAVIPYYLRFLRRFPTLAALARAREDSVLAAWSGLGYYARARNMHRAAKLMHKNGAPQTRAGWEALPGVGKTTAAAIMVFAQGGRCAVLDGNIKRVLARVFAVPQPPANAAGATGAAALWALAENLLPPRQTIRPYTQGMMDLGALVCKKIPLCEQCPLAPRCAAYQQNAVASFPAAAPKKNKPTKRGFFLLHYGGGRVFLQKRPPRGIWGGLWSPPELEKTPKKSGGKVLHFSHAFTHYKLRGTVFCRRTDAPPQADAPPPSSAAAEGGGKWHKTADLRRVALPAPFRVLLSADFLR